jgi:thiamine biosynthesis protein ThiS
MKIILNNQPEEFHQDCLTVNELLEIKKFTFKMLVIKINNRLIRKENYGSEQIREGDDVMVLHLVSGG